MLLAEGGRRDEARAELDVLAADNFAAIPRDNLWLISLALVSAAAFLVGDRDQAEAAYPMLVPFEHRFVTIGQIFCEGSVARVLGEFAAACDRLDDAVTHFELGIARDRAMGNVRSALYGRSELARTLLRRDAPGDADQAAALAAETANEADALGVMSIVRALQGRFRTQ